MTIDQDSAQGHHSKEGILILSLVIEVLVRGYSTLLFLILHHGTFPGSPERETVADQSDYFVKVQPMSLLELLIGIWGTGYLQVHKHLRSSPISEQSTPT